MRSDQRDAEFSAFAAASFTALRRTAFLMVGDWHLAEDVVQAALLGMYRHWHRIEESYGPRAYARRAIVNAAVSELRRPHRYVEELDVVRTADLLGVSEGTVKSQAARGLATLRRHLVPVPSATKGALS